ncbi:MAG: hypothetical protein ACI9N9_002061 [Enterobacterales bacterium]|jgi:hypothetical protein
MTNFNFICTESSFVSAADDVPELPESWCHFERNEDNRELIIFALLVVQLLILKFYRWF